MNRAANPDVRAGDRLDVLGGALLEPLTQQLIAFLAKHPEGASVGAIAILVGDPPGKPAAMPVDVLRRLEILANLALVEENTSTRHSDPVPADRSFRLATGDPRPLLVDGLIDFLSRPLPELDERTSGGDYSNGAA